MLKRGERNAVDNRLVENRNAIFLIQEKTIEEREEEERKENGVWQGVGVYVQDKNEGSGCDSEGTSSVQTSQLLILVPPRKFSHVPLSISKTPMADCRPRTQNWRRCSYLSGINQPHRTFTDRGKLLDWIAYNKVERFSLVVVY